MNADQPDVSTVLELFTARVPQIASGEVAIRGATRDPGKLTVLAVAPKDPSTDAVGACVGNRGAIVKGIVNELRGERIDIALWSDSPKRFISNLLGPITQLSSISLDETTHEATAILSRDSDMPPPHNVRLKSQLLRDLTGWVLRLEKEH